MWALLLVLAGSPDVQRWHDAARRLAGVDKCDKVADLGRGIQVEDARYYAEQFVVDPALAPCFAPPPPPVVQERYRSELVAADLVGLGIAGALDVAAAATHDTTLAGVGVVASIGAYLVVSPCIHVAHDNVRGALVSLGLRVGLPAGAGVIGALIGGGRSQGDAALGDALVGFVGGATIGAALAYALDWGLLPVVTHSSTATTVGIARAF